MATVEVEKGELNELARRVISAGILPRFVVENLHQRGESVTPNMLLDAGVSERALLGFFVAEGFGPVCTTDDIANTNVDFVLDADASMRLLALPLRQTAAGTIVAMANPLDRSAVEELEMLFAGPVLPSVAREQDIVGALKQRFAQFRLPEQVWTDFGNQLDSIHVEDTDADIQKEDTEVSTPPKSAHTRKTSAPPHPQISEPTTQSVDHNVLDLGLDVIGNIPVDISIDNTKDTIIPQRISDIYAEVLPKTDTSNSTETKRPTSQEVDTTHSVPPPCERELAALEELTDRDAAIHLLCRASAKFSDTALFLIRDGNTWHGRDAAGRIDASRARLLRLPTTSMASFGDLASKKEKEIGRKYLASAGDEVLRAHVCSRSKDLLILPLALRSKVVGILVLDGPRYGQSGRSQVRELLRRSGEALERALMHQKKRIEPSVMMGRPSYAGVEPKN